jgi:hypothetical protein
MDPAVAHTQAEETHVRRIAAAAIIFATVTAFGCTRTGEGEYEVERPVIGTTTDTIQTPTVDVHMDTATVRVPDVDITTPSERNP